MKPVVIQEFRLRDLSLPDPRYALWAIVHGGNPIAGAQIVDQDIAARRAN
ncbi:hypothetical protein Z949_402 [Sulfitobacter guttiformis KCTC 32187]|nr:hypothetical protein Z949_402 [Sulfitobacter guttiformis KCTC 32187]